jgi:hypothetical protein
MIEDRKELNVRHSFSDGGPPGGPQLKIEEWRLKELMIGD